MFVFVCFVFVSKHFIECWKSISDRKQTDPSIISIRYEFPKEVKSFKEGKTKLLGFFVGQLMKKTKGKADPKLANKLISEKLNS